ncbi:MAG: 4-hydroxy-tetrahydrodipicolinate reductase, partial [Pseudomonadota bacterium]
MSTLRIAVCGAAGRMGGALIREIEKADGLALSAALEWSGSPALGADSGKLSGLDENGIAVSADISSALEGSDGVIDFTSPAASVALAEMVAGHNCFHVIGTTGCTDEEDQHIAMAAKAATIVKSGNM